MWGPGNNFDISRIGETNPFLSNLAFEQKVDKPKAKQSDSVDREEIELSREAKRQNPVVESMLEDQGDHREGSKREGRRSEEDEEPQENHSENPAEKPPEKPADNIRSAWHQALGFD